MQVNGIDVGPVDLLAATFHHRSSIAGQQVVAQLLQHAANAAAQVSVRRTACCASDFGTSGVR
jgi:hypothetical protein